MQVKNITTHKLMAVIFHHKHGAGSLVTIQPGETKEVRGAYIGEIDGRSCYTTLQTDVDEIICHEEPDRDTAFRVIPGQPLCLGNELEACIRIECVPEEAETPTPTCSGCNQLICHCTCDDD